MATQRAPDFYDVFISYRHRDEAAVKELEAKIRGLGYRPFLDFNFPRLKDASEVTREKVEEIREAIAGATCLIFAYSLKSAEEEALEEGTAQHPPEESPVGLWMPWELGFFDGCLAPYRIGVYLLDGTPVEFEPKRYFRRSEYLQLYPAVSDDGRNPKSGEKPACAIHKLDDFLANNAVPERRVDNVASAFIWFEHLAEEWLANPTNVMLGIAEWQTEHVARFWDHAGQRELAKATRRWKACLDQSRVTLARRLRMPMVDAFFESARNQGRLGARGVSSATNAAVTAAEALSGAHAVGKGKHIETLVQIDLVRALSEAWLPMLSVPTDVLPTEPPASEAPGIRDMYTDPRGRSR